MSRQFLSRRASLSLALPSAIAVLACTASARAGCVGNDEVSAIGARQMEMIAQIKQGRCELIGEFLQLTTRERALLRSHQSPTCKVTLAPLAPRGMFYDGIYGEAAPPLNSFSNYCSSRSADRNARRRGTRICDGRVTPSEYSTNSQHCLTVNAQCGFTITARAGRSDGMNGITFPVGGNPETKCSDNLNWKYIYKGYTDRGVD